MKISIYRNHFREMWFFGLIACWGENDVETIGICLGGWEFGINIKGI